MANTPASDLPTTTATRLARFVESAVAGEKVRAFVPPPLPLAPPLELRPLLAPLGRADRALGCDPAGRRDPSADVE